MSLLFVDRRSRMIELPNSIMFLVGVMRVSVPGDYLLVSSFFLRVSDSAVFTASSLKRSRLDCSRVRYPPTWTVVSAFLLASDSEWSSCY